MSSYRVRPLTSVNNENPVKNIKNNGLLTNRKKTALRVLTNTVQSTKKCDGKGLKQLKVLPMKNFDSEVKCKSPLKNINNELNEELEHFGCVKLENECLPPSMTCNIGLLSKFFSGSKDVDDNDWILEDLNNIMINKIKNTFENFGEADMEPCLPPLLEVDFPEIIF